MFDFADPVATGVLDVQGALGNYREIMDSFYQFAADQPGTLFEKLERFPSSSPQETREWPAFPKTASKPDQTIDDERFNWQDEYVEWKVTTSGGQVSKIVFTTELAEYYEAFAEVSAAALIAAIKDATGGTPTADEIFGSGFDPSAVTPQQRADRFRERTVVPFNAPLNTVPANPWNNGMKGIICLGQRFNTMGALFNLARKCGVPNPGIPVGDQCASTGGACGPQRNSDPRICKRVQEVSRIPRALSLADPAGIHIVRLDGAWRVNGTAVDINDETSNQGVWVVDRNGRRGTLDLTKPVTLDSDTITTGTQVSRKLQVGADLISADPSDLLPSIAGAALAARAPKEMSRTREGQ